MNDLKVTGYVLSVERVNYWQDKHRWEVVVAVHNPRLKREQQAILYGYLEKASEECARLYVDQLVEFHCELSSRQGRDGKWYSEASILRVDPYEVDPEA